MKDYASYYTENLYPLQDGILELVKRLRTPFYLTGGTALSRGYFGHRYSDDLDFFVNARSDFADLVGRHLEALEDSKYPWVVSSDGRVFARDFVSLRAIQGDVVLKIDFVNDVAPHFGDLVDHPTLGQIDSLANLLSNKLSALHRFESKDIADLWVLARNRAIDWHAAFSEARAKEGGVDPVVVSEIIASFPRERFADVKWAIDIDEATFLSDLKALSLEVLSMEIPD